MSYRSAQKARQKRASIAAFIDSKMESIASKLRLCGEGKRHNWSVLFAQIFLADCSCCYFYRGVTVGVIICLPLIIVALFI